MGDDIPPSRRSAPANELLYELLPTGARLDHIQHGIGGGDDTGILISSSIGNLFLEHLLSRRGFWVPFYGLDRFGSIAFAA